MLPVCIFNLNSNSRIELDFMSHSQFNSDISNVDSTYSTDEHQGLNRWMF